MWTPISTDSAPDWSSVVTAVLPPDNAIPDIAIPGVTIPGVAFSGGTWALIPTA